MGKSDKKKYSDAMDALSAMAGGQEPAQQQPHPPPQSAEPPPPPQPSPQQPTDQRPDSPAAPAPRPAQPTPAAQRPARVPQPPNIPKIPAQSAGPPQVAKARPASAARRAVRKGRASRRPAARRAATRRQPAPPLDAASYKRKQTMIPVLLVTGVLVLILAVVLAVNLPSGQADDATHMAMPPHPMLSNWLTKWIVLAMFPVGAGLLFGAFMFILQVQKQPPPEDQAAQQPHQHDRGIQKRRR